MNYKGNINFPNNFNFICKAFQKQKYLHYNSNVIMLQIYQETTQYYNFNCNIETEKLQNKLYEVLVKVTVKNPYFDCIL